MSNKNEKLQAQDLVQSGRFVPPPPSGYVQLLAREFDVDVRTVTHALRDQTVSRIAINIRRAYMKKYIEPYL